MILASLVWIIEAFYIYYNVNVINNINKVSNELSKYGLGGLLDPSQFYLNIVISIIFCLTLTRAYIKSLNNEDALSEIVWGSDQKNNNKNM